MPTTITPSDVDPNSQYAPDSAPNQNVNCGPTTITNVLKYHQDRDYPINETRRLATRENGRGTSSAERKVMLTRRGTPCDIRKLTPDMVKNLLTGRRSLELAMLMSEIPLAIRKRPFPGTHSVCAVSKGRGLCAVHKRFEEGIYVDNPDFHPSRGEVSRYFYPDHAWSAAFLALGGFAVVPDKEKVILNSRIPWKKKCTTKTALRARSGPGTNFQTIKLLPVNTAFTSIQLERKGGIYTIGKTRRRDWLSFNLQGRRVWVARAYVKEG